MIKRMKMRKQRWSLCCGVLLLLLVLAAAACAPAALPTPTPAALKPAPAAATPTTAAPAPAAATPTSAPAKPTQAAPTPTPRPVTLKFGTTGALAFSGIYIAIEKGFFKEQGIEIEIVPFRTVGEMVAPLGVGQVDLAGMPVSPALLAALDRGIELKVVATGGQQRQGWGSVWAALRKDLADSGKVKTPADLKGMKLAIASQGSYLDMFARLVMEEGGLRESDVDLVVLPHAEQVTALANKAIAVGFTTEPFIVRGVQQGLSVKWIPDYKYFGGASQGAAVVFGSGLLKDKEVAQRWMTAYLKGLRAYTDAFEKKIGRDEVVRILAKLTEVKEPELYDLMELPYLEPNGALDKGSMDKQYKWYVDTGVYKGKSTFDDLVDRSLVEYAAQKLGRR